MIGDCDNCGHSVAYHVPLLGCVKCQCGEFRIGPAALVLLAVLCLGCDDKGGAAPLATAPPSVVAASLPAAPPCIHEVCADRPRYLQCVETRTGFREAPSCLRFEILYEGHCDCDRWGAAPLAARGAP